jgi:hypothetical protein
MVASLMGLRLTIRGLRRNPLFAAVVILSLALGSAFGVLRHEVQQMDSSMPVYEMKTPEAQLDETLRSDRLIAVRSAGFGLLATVLASIGLYRVMALVMREVVWLLSIGLGLGIPAAMALGRLVSAQLYGIPAYRASRIDPVLALRYE